MTQKQITKLQIEYQDIYSEMYRVFTRYQMNKIDRLLVIDQLLEAESNQ